MILDDEGHELYVCVKLLPVHEQWKLWSYTMQCK
jgi:hypothetical protein